MTALYTNFVFSNQPRYRIARHLTFWAVSVIFFTLIYGNKVIRPNLAISFVEALVYLPTHIIATYLIIYWIIPACLLKGKYIYALAGVMVITIWTAAFSFLLTEFAIIPLRQSLGLPLPYNTLFAGFMAGLRGSNTVAGFAAAIKLTKHWYQKNQLNQQLEQEKLRAELQLLKAQVHPHFLFNTLNNLYSLALLKSEQTPEVVLKLSALLRYMLYECNVPQVPLEKEMKLMHDYIELEKLRYGDRLDLSVNMQGDWHGKLIAPLVLLPFLENSFKHGASEQLDQAWISLDILVKGDTLKMKLINGVHPSTQPADIGGPLLQGIGLQNVHKRLSLLYPDTHELKIIREAETFMVSLVLQLDRVEEARQLPEKTTFLYEI